MPNERFLLDISMLKEKMSWNFLNEIYTIYKNTTSFVPTVVLMNPLQYGWYIDEIKKYSEYFLGASSDWLCLKPTYNGSKVYIKDEYMNKNTTQKEE